MHIYLLQVPIQLRRNGRLGISIENGLERQCEVDDGDDVARNAVAHE